MNKEGTTANFSVHMNLWVHNNYKELRGACTLYVKNTLSKNIQDSREVEKEVIDRATRTVDECIFWVVQSV